MTDPTPDSEPAPPSAPAAPPPHRKRWWHHGKLVLAIVLLTPLVLFVLYTIIALNWSYSEGQRAGYLQKFSKKGWLCKTWEGELAVTSVPGVAPVIWSFSVRKSATARQMDLAAGRRVVLYYQEHRGVPTTCFGDTNYFVDSLHIIK